VQKISFPIKSISFHYSIIACCLPGLGITETASDVDVMVELTAITDGMEVMVELTAVTDVVGCVTVEVTEVVTAGGVTT